MIGLSPYKAKERGDLHGANQELEKRIRSREGVDEAGGGYDWISECLLQELYRNIFIELLEDPEHLAEIGSVEGLIRQVKELVLSRHPSQYINRDKKTAIPPAKSRGLEIIIPKR